MNTDGMIEVTGASLTEIVKAAYDLSNPQGMGFLHYQGGGLTDEEAEAIWKRERADGHIAALMDYVKGRACKMTVFRDGNRLFIRGRWFDHTDADLDEFLKRINVSRPAQS